MKIRPVAPLLLCLALPLWLSGCGAVCDQHIDGPYYLVALDEMDDLSVSYRVEDGMYVGRIEGRIAAVGWDATHIVAKRVPAGARAAEYYVLTRDADSTYADPSASVQGPLSNAAFQQRARAGAVPRLREVRGCSIE